MTALAGAPSTRIISWKTIIWSEVEDQVKRLQLRIAKAIKIGQYCKVKALQWILTHSFYDSEFDDYFIKRTNRTELERINSRTAKPRS